MHRSNGKNSSIDIHTHGARIPAGDGYASPAGSTAITGGRYPRDVQTVFHLIADEPAQRATALTIAQNLTEDDAVDMDDVAIVAQADGIEPLTAGGDGSETVESLLETGVAVKACSNTLDLKDLAESDLVEGVETVSSGGGELTRLQDEGYAYIRP